MTDMRRGESVLELDVCVQEEIEQGIESDGSNLSGVSARCSWVEADPDQLSPCISGKWLDFFKNLALFMSFSASNLSFLRELQNFMFMV